MISVGSYILRFSTFWDERTESRIEKSCLPSRDQLDQLLVRLDLSWNLFDAQASIAGSAVFWMWPWWVICPTLDTLDTLDRNISHSYHQWIRQGRGGFTTSTFSYVEHKTSTMFQIIIHHFHLSGRVSIANLAHCPGSGEPRSTCRGAHCGWSLSTIRWDLSRENLLESAGKTGFLP